jgi:hypothetical protein
VSGAASALPTNTTVDPTSWNAIANIVGCGTGSLCPVVFHSLIPDISLAIQDITPEQFECMKNISFRTLEDAVIESNVNFGLVIDGKAISQI